MEPLGVTYTKYDQQQQQHQHRDAVIILLNNINSLLKCEKRSKQTAKYVPAVKQLLNALSGTDFDLIRRAEYYSDLKETLRKIEHNIQQTAKRTLIGRLMMSSRRSACSVEDMQKNVDRLCGRILFSYAEWRLMKKMSLQ